MKIKLDNNKKFEKPELEIVYFEGDLATDILVTSGDYNNPGEQEGDMN